MLYELLVSFADSWSPLNVFRYLTFRTAMSASTGLLFTLALGPYVIGRLRDAQIGEQIRAEGPASHASKQGTPTMGGILIVAAIIVSTVLWADVRNVFVWLALAGTVGFSALGFLDDYMGAVHSRRRGLSARSKFLAQFAMALAIGGFLWWLASVDIFTTQLSLPLFKNVSPHLNIWYVPFAALVLVGASNAVNLTDGLDGLATGCVMVSAIAYTALAYVAGHAVIADYLDIIFVPGIAEITVFAGAIVGACLGFLWYNCHPAQVFMGDTGSLALGAAVGLIALLIKQELVLVLVGGVFCLEALSVIIQVASFRTTGKRVFRMAPLHHHFELAGWAESKVIVRFWILSMLFALLSLATLKLR
ncbi:MAG: phospho-N-acetylmuramoyl-pentapeptide-transferase [Acidobacteria bacterium]|nr:phospho-N-acetylmuramoyl-pentapeptide-transferase [Acidobacteriota bacterium]